MLSWRFLDRLSEIEVRMKTVQYPPFNNVRTQNFQALNTVGRRTEGKLTLAHAWRVHLQQLYLDHRSQKARHPWPACPGLAPPTPEGVGSHMHTSIAGNMGASLAATGEGQSAMAIRPRNHQGGMILFNVRAAYSSQSSLMAWIRKKPGQSGPLTVQAKRLRNREHAQGWL